MLPNRVAMLSWSFYCPLILNGQRPWSWISIAEIRSIGELNVILIFLYRHRSQTILGNVRKAQAWYQGIRLQSVPCEPNTTGLSQYLLVAHIICIRHTITETTRYINLYSDTDTVIKRLKYGILSVRWEWPNSKYCKKHFDRWAKLWKSWIY